MPHILFLDLQSNTYIWHWSVKLFDETTSIMPSKNVYIPSYDSNLCVHIGRSLLHAVIRVPNVVQAIARFSSVVAHPRTQPAQRDVVREYRPAGQVRAAACSLGVVIFACGGWALGHCVHPTRSRTRRRSPASLPYPCPLSLASCLLSPVARMPPTPPPSP